MLQYHHSNVDSALILLAERSNFTQSEHRQNSSKFDSSSALILHPHKYNFIVKQSHESKQMDLARFVHQEKNAKMEWKGT